MSSWKENRCLFIALPQGETISLKRLGRTIGTRNLTAAVELSAGIPAEVFTLHFLGKPVEDSIVLNFGENIHSGAILRVVIKPKWSTLCVELCHGFRSLKGILNNYKAAKSEDHTTGKEANDLSSVLTDKTHFHNRMFVSLFISASRGYDELCTKILDRGKPTQK